MAKLYFNKIRDRGSNILTGETWTIDDVPDRWKVEVQNMLDELETEA